MKKTKKIVSGLIGFFLALPALCLGATDWYDNVFRIQTLNIMNLASLGRKNLSMVQDIVLV